jgi:TPR repeat protein
MHALGDFYLERHEDEHAVKWFTKSAVAGLPLSMFNLGVLLEGAGRGGARLSGGGRLAQASGGSR